jgi:hypothetical protein
MGRKKTVGVMTKNVNTVELRKLVSFGRNGRDRVHNSNTNEPIRLERAPDQKWLCYYQLERVV